MLRLAIILLTSVGLVPQALASTPIRLSFTSGQTIAGFQNPCALAAGNLRGTGVNDLVVFDCGTSTANVLLNDGTGHFTAGQVIPNLGVASNIVLADVNGDGKLDLIIGGGGPGKCVAVLLGNGDGTFQAPKTYACPVDPPEFFRPLNVSELFVGDMNGDGKPDVIVMGFSDLNEVDTGGVWVYYGNGDGTFQAPVNYQGSSSTDLLFVVQGVLTDLNGDGSLDLVYSGYNAEANASYWGWTYGNGTGAFNGGSEVDYAGFPDSAIQVNSISVGDVNGDAIPDLIVSLAGVPQNGSLTNTASGPCVALGNGAGSFALPCTLQVGLPSDYQGAYTPGDFTGSGRTDLLVSGESPGAGSCNLSFLVGKGNGSFAPGPVLFSQPISPQCESGPAAIADFNGDGLPDIAAAEPNGSVQIFINNSAPDIPPIATNASFNIAVNGSVQPLSAVLQASSPLNNPLVFSIVNGPAHGTVQITDIYTGAFTYTPAANFPSSGDSFTFDANDGYMNSNTATVTVTASGGSQSGGGGSSKDGGGLSLVGLGMLLMFYLGQSAVRLSELRPPSSLN